MSNGYAFWFTAVVLAAFLTVVIAYHDVLIALVAWALVMWVLLMLRPE